MRFVALLLVTDSKVEFLSAPSVERSLYCKQEIDRLEKWD